MNDCIFCKILKGEIPSCKIYEDDHAIVFLDIAPFEKGHVLVVPKVHAQQITELPVAELQPVMEVVQKTARVLKEKLPCDGINILQNNGACAMQTVPHVHIHLVPRWNRKEGEEMNWTAKAYDSMDEMKALAARLAF